MTQTEFERALAKALKSLFDKATCGLANSTMERMKAHEEQITHLQDVLKAVAEVLPQEYE